MENIKFTRIEKHPLNNNFMLYCPVSYLAPFFGTLAQCKEMQPKWEKKFNDSFVNLSKEEQGDIMKRLELYN